MSFTVKSLFPVILRQFHGRRLEANFRADAGRSRVFQPTSRTSIRLAEQIIAHYPYTNAKVLFAPSGAAAVEIALMVVKVNTGRFKTVSFWDSYCGCSAGALSGGGTRRDKSPRLGPLMPGALHAPPFYTGAQNSRLSHQETAGGAQAFLDVLCTLFASEHDIAAFIVGRTWYRSPYCKSGLGSRRG
jgi:4-aminobutyrate aminotransferase